MFKTRLSQPRINENIDVSFVTFSARLSVYIVWPSGLDLNNLKLHKTLKRFYIEEKLVQRSTFNPGLALTSFRIACRTGVFVLRILDGEAKARRKQGEREVRNAQSFALLPSRAYRASRSPHFRVCPPKIRKKLRLFCRLAFQQPTTRCTTTCPKRFSHTGV